MVLKQIHAHTTRRRVVELIPNCMFVGGLEKHNIVLTLCLGDQELHIAMDASSSIRLCKMKKMPFLIEILKISPYSTALRSTLFRYSGGDVSLRIEMTTYLIRKWHKLNWKTIEFQMPTLANSINRNCNYMLHSVYRHFYIVIHTKLIRWKLYCVEELYHKDFTTVLYITTSLIHSNFAQIQKGWK